MRRLRSLVFFIALQGVASAAQPPLLEIYEARIDGPGKVSFAGDKPLLVIREVRAWELASDGKGVAVYLTPEDTKAFAEISRSHLRGYVVAKATDDIMLVLYFSSANLVGRLIFSYPEEENMAAYFRSRLHLASPKT